MVIVRNNNNNNNNNNESISSSSSSLLSSSLSSTTAATTTTTTTMTTINNQQSNNTHATSNRRTRTLNQSNNNNNNNSNNNPVSSGGTSCSSDINSDSDSEQSVRVGNEYQAEISDICQMKPASRDYAEKAVLVWTPYHELDDNDLSDYVKLANEKYKYNQEQALGILLWHDFDMNCALADLPNYAPYPDEWTMEDRALFDQAYQFHNKNFHKINQLLPDKKLSSIIKHYYKTKKNKRNINNNSYVDKQIRKQQQQQQHQQQNATTKDDGNMDVDNNNIDFIKNNNNNNQQDETSSNHEQQPNQNSDQSNRLIKECCQCMNKQSNQYYNTKYGILCRLCYIKRKKSSSKTKTDIDDNEEMESKFTKLYNSMNMDEIMLNEIIKERTTLSTKKVLQSYDNEINDLMEKICSIKQENEMKKSLLTKQLPDLSILNNNSRIMSRWTTDEIPLMIQAVRDYGKDYKVIADIIGTKSEVQIKNYFLQNQDKLKLDTLITELNEENDMLIDNDNDNNGGGNQQLFLIDDNNNNGGSNECNNNNITTNNNNLNNMNKIQKLSK